MKSKTSIKGILHFFCAMICAVWLILFRREPRKLIVLYHGITEQHKKSFEKQINYITKKFRVVPLAEILSNSEDETCEMIAITFDDAFENLLHNTIPVLTEKGILSAIFVPTGFIGQYPNWDIPCYCMDRNEKIMTAEQLVQLDQAGHGIYSHTVTHPYLAAMDDKQLHDELYNSKAVLEKILGHPVQAISYPHGSCNGNVFRVAQQAGYQYGLTIERSFLNDTDHKMALPRIPILPDESMLVFKLRLMGAYGLATSLFRKIRSFFKKDQQYSHRIL